MWQVIMKNVMSCRTSICLHVPCWSRLSGATWTFLCNEVLSLPICWMQKSIPDKEKYVKLHQNYFLAYMQCKPFRQIAISTTSHVITRLWRIPDKFKYGPGKCNVVACECETCMHVVDQRTKFCLSATAPTVRLHLSYFFRLSARNMG